MLGLDDVLKKKPRTLSGGQRQRVAMGRAIVREPQAFLMDEPLSNLDAKLRVQMRAEIARIQRDLERDDDLRHPRPVEAMTLGDRVAVMREGELQQLDAPQELYREPVEPLRRRVHRLAGDEPRRGGARRSGDGRASASTRCRLDGRAGRSPRYEGRKVALGIRPEDLEDARSPARPTTARLPVTVDLREDMGSEIFLHFAVDAPHVATEDVKEAVEADEAVAALEQQAARSGTPFVARVERESRAREGDRVERRRRHAHAPLLRPRDAAPRSRE